MLTHHYHFKVLEKEPYLCTSQKRLLQEMEIKEILEMVAFLRLYL